MKIVKTGAVIFLEQYGAYAISDMFEGHGCAIFRIAHINHLRNEWGDLHATIHDVDQWFDRNSGRPSTLVTNAYSIEER
jgi:hypothetical protein